MILILFFVAFVILIYLFISTHRTVVVYEEPAPVSWWAWPITSYNWWPYWNGSYGGSYAGSYGGGVVHHKGPRHTPHQESRPWGGASRYANASAPSRGGHSAPSGGHSAPSGGSRGGHSGGGHGGGGHR
jgi:hypothetical protein